MTSNRSVSEMVERVFTEPVVEQSKRLSVFPHYDAESPATWIMRVRKAAMLDALSSQAQSDDVVERVARAMKTWAFAKSPCLDGYRICGVVVEGDRTSFPSKTFKTIAEARAALDDLNARAAIAAISPAGGVEEPTDAMVKAGAAKVAEMCGHDEAPRGWDRDVARETFKAMARATLNE